MTILDELVEKKDLRTYCLAREAVLKKAMNRVIANAPNKRKELGKRIVVGRYREIQLLQKLIETNRGFYNYANENWGLVAGARKEQEKAGEQK